MSKVRDKMKKLVMDYHKSGESRATFSKAHGLSIAKLSYWVTYYNKEKKETGNFVQLSPPRTMTQIRIHLPNGIEIECGGSIPEELIEKIMSYA